MNLKEHFSEEKYIESRGTWGLQCKHCKKYFTVGFPNDTEVEELIIHLKNIHDLTDEVNS